MYSGERFNTISRFLSSGNSDSGTQEQTGLSLGHGYESSRLERLRASHSPSLGTIVQGQDWSASGVRSRSLDLTPLRVNLPMSQSSSLGSGRSRYNSLTMSSDTDQVGFSLWCLLILHFVKNKLSIYDYV